MKMVEALISLVVLLSFTSLSILHAPYQHSQLHKYQLAEDVWRVAYLKGCFNQTAPSTQGDEEMRGCLNLVLSEVEQETGLSITFYSPLGVIVGPGVPEEKYILLRKAIVVDGIPQKVEVRVG